MRFLKWQIILQCTRFIQTTFMGNKTKYNDRSSTGTCFYAFVKRSSHTPWCKTFKYITGSGSHNRIKIFGFTPLKLTIHFDSFSFQDFNAKLGDFELARVSHESEATDITTSVAGSFGYVDPEYAMTCRLQLTNVNKSTFLIDFFFTKRIIIAKHKNEPF